MTNSNRHKSALSFLPFMPFDPAWIEQSLAFVHADARLGKAALRLIFAAWRGAPAGSVPASHAYIASATGLSEDLVSEHYVTLTDGFVLSDDGKLHHTALAKLCERMTEQYGREIESFALATAMSVQDPDAFGIGNVEAKSKRGPRGKCLMPKGFGYDLFPDLRQFGVECGYYPTEHDQDWIMSKFIDFASRGGEMYKDWSAAFRTYARNERESFNRFPPPDPNQTQSKGLFDSESTVYPARRPSPFEGLRRGGAQQSRGDAAASRNMEALDRVDLRTSLRQGGAQ